MIMYVYLFYIFSVIFFSLTKDHKPVSYVLLAPSLSPRIGRDGFFRNPGFRKYTFKLDGEDFLSQQYFMNLEHKADFQSLYSYR